MKTSALLLAVGILGSCRSGAGANYNRIECRSDQDEQSRLQSG
jgi:hypothetical protein